MARLSLVLIHSEHIENIGEKDGKCNRIVEPPPEWNEAASFRLDKCCGRRIYRETGYLGVCAAEINLLQKRHESSFQLIQLVK